MGRHAKDILLSDEEISMALKLITGEMTVHEVGRILQDKEGKPFWPSNIYSWAYPRVREAYKRNRIVVDGKHYAP